MSKRCIVTGCSKIARRDDLCIDHYTHYNKNQESNNLQYNMEDLLNKIYYYKTILIDKPHITISNLLESLLIVFPVSIHDKILLDLSALAWIQYENIRDTERNKITE